MTKRWWRPRNPLSLRLMNYLERHYPAVYTAFHLDMIRDEIDDENFGAFLSNQALREYKQDDAWEAWRSERVANYDRTAAPDYLAKRIAAGNQSAQEIEIMNEIFQYEKTKAAQEQQEEDEYNAAFPGDQ